MTVPADIINQMHAAGIGGLQAHDLIIDGKLHRFKPEGARSATGWYVIFEFITRNNQSILSGTFGDWRHGPDKHKIEHDAGTLDSADRARLKTEQDAKRRAADKERKALARRAALRAQSLFPNLATTGEADYLKRKGVQAHGARFSKRGAVVVPIVDITGTIQGLQVIHATPRKTKDGDLIDKDFFPFGMSPRGFFHRIGEAVADVAVVCEGYATGASIYEATGWPVFVAFNRGNLAAVAKAVRKQWPDVRLVVAGDDDFKTKGNPGAVDAQKAAAATAGQVVLPVFMSRGERKLTDFNDLHQVEGLTAVRQQIQAAKSPQEAQAELIDRPDWQRRLAKTQNGLLKPDVNNARLVLEHDKRWAGVLRYSEFHYTVIKIKPPPFEHSAAAGEWTDADTARLRCWLSEHYGFTPRMADSDDAVLVAAQRWSFHPVRDYLGGLQWDGEPRLAMMFSDFFGAEQSDYSAAVGTKWLISAVARVLRPPVKADAVLILEGKQGLLKSSALKALAGDWFADTHFELGHKDGYQQMRGVWLYELAELDAFNKAESTKAKAFFSSERDNYRASYGRRSEMYARQCVFSGTTNSDHYLRDVTGNRRYWPIHCTDIDLVALNQVRDQLWAEAVHRYHAGEVWWVLDKEKGLFETAQEDRFTEDAWEALINNWLHEPDNRCLDEFNLPEIMLGALKMTPDKLRPPEQTRVGQIMRRLGWAKKKVRVKEQGQPTWTYRRPEGEASVDDF